VFGELGVLRLETPEADDAAVSLARNQSESRMRETVR
jgi:hypothetical protein